MTGTDTMPVMRVEKASYWLAERMVPSMRIVSRTCPGAVESATWLMSIVNARQVATPPRRRASLRRYQESEVRRRGRGPPAGASPLAWGAGVRPRAGRWVTGALSAREERPAVSAGATERLRGRTGREPLV